MAARSPEYFLCVSHRECVNFIITKSKHRKGNFISACCQCLCFEAEYVKGLGAEHNWFRSRVYLKMSGNQERLLSTFSRLRFDRTGRGGGPQVHWNVNFGLKWLWLKAVQTQHRRYTVVRLRFKFQRLLCCCLFFFSFLFFCVFSKEQKHLL